MQLRKAEITSQNHGFEVAQESIAPSIEVSFVNLNDQTIEGIRHPSFRFNSTLKLRGAHMIPAIFSVIYRDHEAGV